MATTAMAPLSVANVASNGTVIEGGEVPGRPVASGAEPEQAATPAAAATIARAPADRALTRLTRG
jgi:hypothetical protein